MGLKHNAHTHIRSQDMKDDFWCRCSVLSLLIASWLLLLLLCALHYMIKPISRNQVLSFSRRPFWTFQKYCFRIVCILISNVWLHPVCIFTCVWWNREEICQYIDHLVFRPILLSLLLFLSPLRIVHPRMKRRRSRTTHLAAIQKNEEKKTTTHHPILDTQLIINQITCIFSRLSLRSFHFDHGPCQKDLLYYWRVYVLGYE